VNQPVRVSILDPRVATGSVVGIPVFTSGLTDRNITSYEFLLLHDPSGTEIIGVNRNGTITSSSPTGKIESRELDASIVSAESLRGSGPLLNAEMRLSHTSTTALELSSFSDFDSERAAFAVKTEAGSVTSNAGTQLPVATRDSISTIEGQAVTTDVLANDSDPEGALEPASVRVEQAPPLSVTTVRPRAGIPGTQVSVYGTGFDAAPGTPNVRFGEAAATVTGATANVLAVEVPAEAEPGPQPLRVALGEETISAPDPFGVLQVGQGGTFGPRQVITSEAEGARSVYTADVDQDGAPDVLSASSVDNTIAWYRNEGDGSFGPRQVITTEADGAASVTVADVDQDGTPDVLSASPGDNTIAWHRNEGDGSFGPRQVITTTSDVTWSVYAADVDQDGYPDVLSASSGDRTIAWHRNEGDGSFGPRQVITSDAGGAYSVYTADVDQDGSLDVLSASSGDNTIAWHRNKGDGSFGPRQVITTEAQGARSVYAADVDQDGDPDVLSASVNDDVAAWYENEGEGGFGPRQVITSTDGEFVVRAADLDGDGDPDVLSGDSNAVKWFKNEGGNSFNTQQPIEPTGGIAARSIHAVDIDGDGDLDVVAALDGEDSIAWYENAPNQPPLARADTAETTDGQAITTDVLANDSDPEGALDPASVQVEQGPSNGTASANGDGTITYTPSDGFTGTDTYTYTVADTLRARSDAATVTVTVEVPPLSVTTVRPRAGIPGTQVSVYGTGFDAAPGTPDVRFGEAAATVTGATANVLAVEVPAEAEPGPQPLRVTSGGETISAPDPFGVLQVGQGGTFGPRQVITSEAEGARSVYTADVDQDGAPDVLSASSVDNTIAWYRNEGDGSFGPRQVITTEADGAASVTVADVDQDGAPDVLSASRGDNTIAWHRNEGNGSFGPRQVITTAGGEPQSVHTADLDQDGDHDLISARLSSLSATDAPIAWYANDGAGNFGLQQAIRTAFDAAEYVYADDVDLDGDLDVLSVSASLNDHAVAWHQNDGGGKLGSPQVISSGAGGLESVYLADVDNDGDPDVLSASGSTIAWQENEGEGSFGPQQVITTAAKGAWSVYSADVNQDGYPDALSASWGDNTIAWHRNEGDGSFGPRQVITTAADAAWSVDAADIDQDGDLDVLAALVAGDAIVWYENAPNQLPVARADTAETTDGQAVTTDVLANDSDPEGALDPASVRVEQAPSSGTASANGDGTITYAPSDGFTGTDTYTYTVADTLGARPDPATVVVTVTNRPPPPVTDLSVSFGDQQATIAWNAVAPPDFAEYRVYQERGSTSGPRNLVQAIQDPSVSEVTVTELENRVLYHLYVTVVDEAGLESTADTVRALPRAPTIPLDHSLSFGDPDRTSSFRMVGLPGHTSSVSLSSTLSGIGGEDWTAYHVPGVTSNEDFVAYTDQPDQFQFQPGRGFWLLNTSPWEPQMDVPVVPLSDRLTYTLSLPEGWSIITNPFPVPVPWDSVVGEYVDENRTVVTLWDYFSTYLTVDAMQPYRGYYVFNNPDDPIDSLKIPYPFSGWKSATSIARTQASPERGFKLTANNSGQQVGVEVGIDPKAEEGRDRFDQFAPPRLGGGLSMTLHNPKVLSEYPYLHREARPAEMDSPTTFDVVLSASPGTRVTVDATDVRGLDDEAVYLLDPETQQLSNLTTGTVTVRLPPNRGSSASRKQVQVLVGTQEDVEKRSEDLLPETFSLAPNYPDPVHSTTTIAFTVPRTVEKAHVELVIYNVLGQEVQHLVDGERTPGRYVLQWGGDGRHGQRLGSGVYLCQFVVDGSPVATEKIVLVR
jgi:hypothetical protein